MAGQQDVIVVVEDLREFSTGLSELLVQTWPRGRPEVLVSSHRYAFECPDDDWQQLTRRGLRAVLVDAHDLSRERAWDRGAEDRPFPLAGAEVGSRLLSLPEPPRLIMYSGEMGTNPMINVALREATGSRAHGYYDAEALLDPAILASALRDPVPIGQFPAPSDEDLATYAGAWQAAREAHSRPGTGVFDLLVGGEEAIKAVRALPATARNTTQKALRRLAVQSGFREMRFRPWDEVVRRMQEITGRRRTR